jgi:hypothetical protein
MEPGADIDKDIAGLNALAPNWSNQDDRNRLSEIKKQLPLLRAVQENAIAHAAGGRRDSVVQAGNESADHATPILIALKKSLGTMAESFDQLVDENKEELKADNRSLMLMVALTTFVGLGIAVCVALFLTHRFVGAIQAVLASKSDCSGGLDGRGASGPEPGRAGRIDRGRQSDEWQPEAHDRGHHGQFRSRGQRQRGTFLLGHVAGPGRRHAEGPNHAGDYRHAGDGGDRA